MQISVSNGILDPGVTACGACVIVAAPAREVHMIKTIIMTMMIILVKDFAALDELGTCRTSLVSPEQPVLCTHERS